MLKISGDVKKGREMIEMEVEFKDVPEVLTELTTLAREVYEKIDDDGKRVMKKNWNTIMKPWITADEQIEYFNDKIDDIINDVIQGMSLEDKKELYEFVSKQSTLEFLPKEVLEKINKLLNILDDKKEEQEDEEEDEEILEEEIEKVLEVLKKWKSKKQK